MHVCNGGILSLSPGGCVHVTVVYCRSLLVVCACNGGVLSLLVVVCV